MSWAKVREKLDEATEAKLGDDAEYIPESGPTELLRVDLHDIDERNQEFDEGFGAWTVKYRAEVRRRSPTFPEGHVVADFPEDSAGGFGSIRVLGSVYSVRGVVAEQTLVLLSLGTPTEG